MKHLENRPSGGVLSSSLQALNFPGGWFLPLEESGGGRRTSAPSCYLRHVANPARSPRTTCFRRPCTQGRRSWRGDRGGKEKDHNLRANANTAWSPPAISLFTRFEGPSFATRRSTFLRNDAFRALTPQTDRIVERKQTISRPIVLQ